MRLREKKGPRKKKKFNDHVLTRGGERGILLYISYIGMCRPKWYGFGVVLVWNRVINFAFLVWNRVWFWQGLPWDRTVHLFLLLFWHWPGTFIYIYGLSGSGLKKSLENPIFWSGIGSGFWCKSYKGHEMKWSTCTTNSSYEHLTACFSVRRVLTWREMPPFLCAVVVLCWASWFCELLRNLNYLRIAQSILKQNVFKVY